MDSTQSPGSIAQPPHVTYPTCHNEQLTEPPCALSSSPAAPRPSANPDIAHPTIHRPILLALLSASIFLVHLNLFVVCTASPRLTDVVGSTTDLSWYFSTFLLSAGAAQPIAATAYTRQHTRTGPILAASLTLMLAGAVLCGAAVSARMFIAGRVVAGLGAAGVLCGCYAVLLAAVPPHRELISRVLFGAPFAVAALVGPLVGGAFTSDVTWRWCFYFTLPLGSVVLAGLLAVLNHVKVYQDTGANDKTQLVDSLSFVVAVGSVVCLVLGIQWGGLEHAWSSGTIIALFILAALSLLGSMTIRFALPTPASPFFKEPGFSGSHLTSFFVGASMVIFICYIPIWLQTVKGFTAVQSGVRILPLVVAMILAGASSSVLASKFRHRFPMGLIGIILMSTGAGLLTTLNIDSSRLQWASYQLLYGLGLGTVLQNLSDSFPLAVVATGLKMRIAGTQCSQFLGGAIFITIAYSVFMHGLLKHLPDVGFSTIKTTSLTSLADLSTMDETLLRAALNSALRRTFYVGLAASCLAAAGVCMLEWATLAKTPRDTAACPTQGTPDEAQQHGPGNTNSSPSQPAVHHMLGPGTLTWVGGILQQKRQRAVAARSSLTVISERSERDEAS
ncbi:hypothetical protein BROUX41_004760 [Berkeleyomyces rouxiae]|uniref:uncharacterized protein n=1 Tax=Berkeleyomyces rouxiae TaxID=2035830 RepID=UPI003B76A230